MNPIDEGCHSYSYRGSVSDASRQICMEADLHLWYGILQPRVLDLEVCSYNGRCCELGSSSISYLYIFNVSSHAFQFVPLFPLGNPGATTNLNGPSDDLKLAVEA